MGFARFPVDEKTVSRDLATRTCPISSERVQPLPSLLHQQQVSL